TRTARVNQLSWRTETGRGVRTEAQGRAQATRAPVREGEPAEAWARMRALEEQMHPAERALLWNQADRIEELIAQLPDHLREKVYQRLLDAGIISITRLADLVDNHPERLRAIGLSRGQIRLLNRLIDQRGKPAWVGP